MISKKKVLIGSILLILLFTMQTTSICAAGEKLLHEESFTADYNLKGVFASCEEYFHVGNWNISQAKLKIFYTATTLVREEVSDFTISLNGESIYSHRVPLTAGETKELTIDLPKRLLKEGINAVRIESYIRTNVGEPCEDDISGASWMVVQKDSYVSVSYESAVHCKSVSDVYEQLTSIEGLEEEESAVLLMPEPTEDELTAAAYVLTGVAGNAVLSYDALKLEVLSQASSVTQHKYGVVISEYQRLPNDIKECMSNEQKDAAQADAVIAYVKTDPNTQLLIITGSNVKAMENAAKLFGNQAAMTQINASYRKVTDNENVAIITQKLNASYLTETGSYVSGPFIQTASFSIPMNANRCIAAGSEVELYFRYAQNLDFTRSLVTVYIGDTPIGSKRLEEASANGDMLKVTIPDNLQITGNFQLNVTFDLEMKELICDIRRQDVPWAYVTRDSTVSLNTKEIPWLLFDYYPSPFVQEDRLNQVLLVLPKQESKEDLDAMRKILLTLGRYISSNAGTVRVCRANNMTALTQANIISIGAYKDNPIASQFNSQLYFKFSPKGTTILSNEKTNIEPNYGATLGTAQLIRSPYGTGEQALLIVSGITKKGMVSAADFLGNVQKNWQIYGDGYIADNKMVSCYRFGEDNEKRNSIGSDLATQSDVVMFLVAGSCVLILLLLSLFMIWKKHRRRGR